MMKNNSFYILQRLFGSEPQNNTIPVVGRESNDKKEILLKHLATTCEGDDYLQN